MNLEVRLDVLNVFDNVNFDPFNYTTISNTRTRRAPTRASVR